MDIWAVGCVLFEMLTKDPLFPGADEFDQIIKIHEILGTPDEDTISRMFEYVLSSPKRDLSSLAH
jgi:renal tumor antigen